MQVWTSKRSVARSSSSTPCPPPPPYRPFVSPSEEDALRRHNCHHLWLRSVVCSLLFHLLPEHQHQLMPTTFSPELKSLMISSSKEVEAMPVEEKDAAYSMPCATASRSFSLSTSPATSFSTAGTTMVTSTSMRLWRPGPRHLLPWWPDPWTCLLYFFDLGGLNCWFLQFNHGSC